MRLEQVRDASEKREYSETSENEAKEMPLRPISLNRRSILFNPRIRRHFGERLYYRS
jgi:hypothetical protein